MEPEKNEAEGLEPLGFCELAGSHAVPPHDTGVLGSGQDPSPEYLIGSYAETKAWLDCCPYASTLTGYDCNAKQMLIIQIRCRRWTCRHCGERRVSHYAHKVQKAQPNRLVTLTVNPAHWSEPRAAYDGTRKAVTALATKLRRILGEWEYFRVLEVTKRGWPHYHLVVRSPYIHQPVLSKMWKELTGAQIVDVRQIRKVGDVYSYVVKYLCKQTLVPWTDRRISWSRNFWIDDGFVPAGQMCIADSQRHMESPAAWLEDHWQGKVIRQLSRDCWVLATSEPQKPPLEF